MTYRVACTTLIAFLAISTTLTQAAVYKHVDEAGNVFFTDTPPDNVAFEQVEIKESTTYQAPSQNSARANISGSSLLQQDLQRQKQARAASQQQAEQRERDKQRRAQLCERYQNEIADLNDMRNNVNYAQGYYDGKIAIAKRNADEACNTIVFK